MACFVAMTVAAHTGADVRNIRLLRSDYTVQLVMDIDLKGDGWKQGDVIVFTPRLVGTSDSIDFPEVVVLRRWAYYAEARRGEQPLFAADAYLIRHRGREATEHYARSVRYQPWMDNSVLKLIRAEGDPCRATVTAVDRHQGFVLLPPDTTWVEHRKDDVLEDNVITVRQPAHPWLALKTNLLFDALLTPNVEIEAQLGRDSRWSIMIEDWFPWFLYRKNLHGQARTEHRLIDKIYKNAYQLWAIGGELRYWFRPRCQQVRPWLTGTFAGVYVAGGKYDWEWDSNGDQGEFMSAGLSIGRSWPLSKHWNMELSGSVGAVWGPRRHYQGEYDDTHLIWKYNGNIFYVGPTKLKLSLVWLLPSLKRYRKGGDR